MRSRSKPFRCPQCGAPVEPLQEVCLQCGRRLPAAGRAVPALAAAWRRALPWYPGDWIWPVLVLAIVVAASTAVALGARNARDSSAPALIGPGSPGVSPLPSTAPPPTTAPPPGTAPQPTISTGTLPVAPGAPSTTVPTTPTPTATAPRPSGGVAGWPSGRSGYTDILGSIPESDGRAAAVARAREAQRTGLSGVGVLLSSRYSTLHAGYWVVFAGVYESQAAAQAALASAHAHGYAGAYPARIGG